MYGSPERPVRKIIVVIIFNVSFVVLLVAGLFVGWLAGWSRIDPINFCGYLDKGTDLETFSPYILTLVKENARGVF